MKQLGFETRTPLYPSGVFGILKIVMANKPKKKRTKQYRGVDAAITKPSVTRISAANRSKLGQWWFERKKILRPTLIAIAVIIGITWLIFELIRITTQ